MNLEYVNPDAVDWIDYCSLWMAAGESCGDICHISALKYTEHELLEFARCAARIQLKTVFAGANSLSPTAQGRIEQAGKGFASFQS